MKNKVVIIYTSILFVLRIIMVIATVLTCWYLGGRMCYNGIWLRGISVILIMPCFLIWSLNFVYFALSAPALPFLEKSKKPIADITDEVEITDILGYK